MTTTPLSRTFLAYVRQGLAARIAQPASETAALPARAGLPVKIGVNARTPVALDVQTYGPGDVIGFDEGQIVRTEPAAGAHGFEADLLAAVEFARPDLPWLLTPAAPDPLHGRIRPWLFLVVVAASDSTVTAAAVTPLPVLSCPLAELPDLAESWAWAHAQVTGTPAATVDSLLATPGAALSRLICPRRLAPGTAYIACIVPAFQAGVLAGLGQAAAAGNLAPAWGAGSPATMRLPVYYQWSFSTGPSGDFATLASQLRPRVIQAELGLRDIDISAADPEIPAPDAAHSVIGMSGAAGGGSSADTVPAAFASALETVLAGGATGVGPPVYGGTQAGTGASLPAAGTQPQWLRDLNLDPRHRSAAGMGTRVVQGLQEQLVAGAWAQAAEMAQANRLLGHGRLARAVSSAWYRKHLPDPAPGPAADRLVQLTGLAHDRIRPAAAAQTVSGQVSASAPVAAAVSVPYRRVARPLGPLARRLGAAPAAPLPPPLGPITGGSLVVTPPQAAPAGIVTLDSVSGPAVTYRGITPQLISGAAPWWQGLLGGFPAPANGFWSDLIAFRATASGISWRVGQHLDFDGRSVTGWQAEQTLSTTASHPPQVVAGTISGTAPTTICVISIDPPLTPRTFQLSTGTGIGPSGAVTSWAAPVSIGAAIAGPVLGADVLVTDVTGGGSADTILVWVEQEPSGVNTAKYLLLMPGLLPGLFPTSVTGTLPFTPAGDVGITSGLIGPAGPGGILGQPGPQSPDVLVWWITGPPGARAGQYVIGWQFGTSGPKTWSAPISIQGTLPDNTVALGAALADINMTGRPDLVLYHVEQVPIPPLPPGAPQPQALFQGRYLIGWDLDASGVPAGGWTETRDIPGGWMGTGFGGSVSVASLDPARATEISATGQSFRQQSARLQQALLLPVTLPAPPPAGPAFSSGQLASTVHGALDPAVTIPARLLPQVTVGSAPIAPPGGGDPLAPLVLTPSFPQPMYAPLRDLAADILLPSAEAIPPDTVTLLQADPAFIESYLVGLNHEMSRLLAWRGYPADGTGTYFQHFWDRPPGSAAPPDIPPISTWALGTSLGSHATAAGASGMLLLLVRGALPARWPGLLVRASKAAFAPGPGGLVKNPTDVWLDPVFAGRVDPDLSFYGFALTAAAARSSTGSAVGWSPGWFFVFAERPFEPRFGLEPLPQPPAYGGKPGAWGDLTWGDLATNAASYAALRQISASAPPPGLIPPSPPTLNQVTFGYNAAHMAAITLRLPFQVAIHADEMLGGL
jgi:hypothetical protein